MATKAYQLKGVTLPGGGMLTEKYTKGDGDRGIIRNAEGALRYASDQSQKEGDGDPVHLLWHPHCERGAGGTIDGTTAGRGRRVDRH